MSSNLFVENSKFMEMRAKQGPAIFLNELETAKSSKNATIKNCLFEDNVS